LLIVRGPSLAAAAGALIGGGVRGALIVIFNLLFCSLLSDIKSWRRTLLLSRVLVVLLSLVESLLVSLVLIALICNLWGICCLLLVVIGPSVRRSPSVNRAHILIMMTQIVDQRMQIVLLGKLWGELALNISTSTTVLNYRLLMGRGNLQHRCCLLRVISCEHYILKESLDLSS